MDVIQDFVVWSGMLMLFFISSIPKNNDRIIIIKIIETFVYFYLIILVYFILTDRDDPATMILSLLFYSYFLSKLLVKQIRNHEIYIMLFLFITPLITGSRIIYITMILISFIFIIFFYGNKKSIKDKFKKILIVMISIFSVIIFAIIFQDKINSTMNKGDNAKVAGVSINTSGRSYMWEIVYTSALRTPIYGSGLDGPIEMLKFPKWGHPHNDYLRLFHHNGIIGLLLWLFFFINILFFLRKRIKYSLNIEYKKYYLFNFIFLISIMIIMLTDNPIVYSYVMYPLMIISGTSINLYFNEKQNRKGIF